MASIVRPLGHFGRPLLLLLLLVPLVRSVNAQSHFSCLDGSGNIYNATVIITASGAPEINGVALTAGSEIAVFSSNPAFADTCAGMVTWETVSASIAVWGDDSLTPERDGLLAGEALRFRIWDAESNTEHAVDSADVSYLLGDGVYADDAAFVLSGMSITAQSSGLVAKNDTSVTDEETVVAIPVLANDEGGTTPLDSSSVRVLVPPERGVIVGIDPETGSVSYEPEKDYVGFDTFTYAVDDSTGTISKSASVRIEIRNVNDAPVALADAVTINEDSQATIDILSNDSDVDGPELDYASVRIVEAPASGEIIDIDPATGRVTFQPDPDFHGQDFFTYTVFDIYAAASDTARVDVTIVNLNDAPLAIVDAASTDEDTDVPVDVLGNDTDVDGDALDPASVLIRLFPAYGSIPSVNAETGVVLYRPDPNYAGEDSFSYTVRDVLGKTSNEVLVNITVNPVNDPPVFVGHPIVNTAINLPYDFQIRFRDTEGEAMVITAPVLPSWMTLTDHGDGTADLRGTPSSNDAGVSNIELVAEDAAGGKGLYTYSVRVSDNAAPIAKSDVATSLEDQYVLVNILANDKDPEGDAFDVSTITVITPPEHGIVGYIYPESGEVTYEPDAEFNGFDQFEYQVSDVKGNTSNIVEVLITVVSVNDAPTAVHDEAGTPEDHSVAIDVLANDSDIDGDAIWVSGVVSSEKGSVTINANQTSVTYTPAADFNGVDTFTYFIVDQEGISSTAQVTVTVGPENDVPVITSTPVAVGFPGALYEYTVRASDVDEDVLTATIVTAPSWLAIATATDGSFVLSGTPTSTDLGIFDVIISVSDGVSDVFQQFSLGVTDSSAPLTTRTVLRTPAWGAINIPADTQFSWEVIEGATRYNLQVSAKADTQFDNPIIDEPSIDGTAPSNSLIHFTASGLPTTTQLIWRVRGQNASGFSPWSDASLYRTETGTSSTPNETAEELPAVVELFQNYPNPFNPRTTIAFELPTTTDVTLTIFDLMGREIETLVDRTLSSGKHEVQWNAGSRASGLYLYRLRAGSTVKTKTLSLVK